MTEKDVMKVLSLVGQLRSGDSSYFAAERELDETFTEHARAERSGNYPELDRLHMKRIRLEGNLHEINQYKQKTLEDLCILLNSFVKESQ